MIWSFHYGRRVIEVLFLHDYKRVMSLGITIGAVIYYGGLGVFCAWCTHHQVWKRNGYPNEILLWLGFCVFMIGEIGNAYHHYLLAYMRPVGMTGHVIPTGGMFYYVSCPHYYFELVSWVGYLLLTSITYGALAMLILSFFSLLALAKEKHTKYLKEFNGQNGKSMYPLERKMLIPFLL